MNDGGDDVYSTGLALPIHQRPKTLQARRGSNDVSRCDCRGAQRDGGSRANEGPTTSAYVASRRAATARDPNRRG